MSDKLRFCRRCAWAKEMLDNEKVKLEDYILRIPEEEKVPQSEYERRLFLCDTCKELRGGLCGQCGCYVAVRAARKNQYCPHIHPKW